MRILTTVSKRNYLISKKSLISKNNSLIRKKILVSKKILSLASAESLHGNWLLQCDLSRLGGDGLPALVCFIINILNIFNTIAVIAMHCFE